MNDIAWSIRRTGWPLLLLLGIASAGGCTSAISTAYLRDAMWDSAGHAADDEPEGDGRQEVVVDDSNAADQPPVGAEFEAERRAAAVDEAVARLARIGRLDDPTKATLVQTLQQTAQEDWPAVVAAFADSLETSSATATALPAELATERADPRPHVAAKADLDRPEDAPAALPPEPPAAIVAAESTPAPDESSPAPGAPAIAAAPAVPMPAPEPAVPTPATVAPVAPEPVPASFAVRHACFASRVRAWGDVDRFTESRFTPGQEVIVYVELDNLSSGTSPAGHTSCTDAKLTLVDAAGKTVREWRFEPIAETCPTRRHDYFARYVIRIPDSAPPGGCRLTVAVVDTVASRTASADLPLEVVPRQVAAR